MEGARLAGRYRLGPEVLQGGMGVVHRGEGPDGRPVAIKHLHAGGDAVRFEIEGRLLARLHHPRVVRVLDSIVQGGAHYLVMEWIEGFDLGRVLWDEGDPGLPAERVRGWALGVCEALAYVHAQQTLHRDVKPSNVMLDPERGVVLVDFGIARELSAAEPTIGIGTPGYIAPETITGARMSSRVDVYGLGATVAALLTGAPPALGERLALDIDEALAATLEAALRMDPERRLPSAEAFAAGLGGRLSADAGRGLAVGSDDARAPSALLQAVVRTTAGVFGAAATSLALRQSDGGLVYRAAWGSGADEIVGVRLEPGEGIAGAVLRSGEPEVVANCREDPRWAGRTGYVPHTMLVVPLLAGAAPVGVLTVLDRRDGTPFGVDDLARAVLFADLAVTALDDDEGAAMTRGAPG